MLIEEPPVPNRAGRQKGRMLSPPGTLVGAFQILSHLISVREQSSYPGFTSDYRAKAAPSYFMHNILLDTVGLQQTSLSCQ